MKKLFEFFHKIIPAVSEAAMAAFNTLLSVIQTAFLRSEYRGSAFARETGAAYEAGVTETLVYGLYTRLRSDRIPIEILFHPEHPLNAHLRWRDTLIIHEIDSIARRDGRWVIGPDSSVWKEGLDLQDAVAQVLKNALGDRPGYRPFNAVLLLNRNNIPAADRLEAELMPMFLLYDDDENRVEILRIFCR
jgi:hypothetical protein